MTNRSQFLRALKGERLERIPFGVQANFVTDHPDPLWDELIAAGLTVIDEACTYREIRHNVETIRTQETWRDEIGERLTLRTSIGEITRLIVRGWEVEYFLKSPADYRVMTYIVRNTETIPDASAFIAREAENGDDGFNFLVLGRTPMQTILVDYAGLEGFAGHLADGCPELWELADALMDQLIARSRCIAAGPGWHVSLLENLTAEQWGPHRFAQYHLPAYARFLPILHDAGKQVHAHMDGQLACLASLIAHSGLDGIESLTALPEGDMTYTQARAAWPDLMLWGNFNVGLYDLPPAELRAVVHERRRAAAPDGRHLIMEISEDLPLNWRQSLPVVLAALAETGGAS